MVFDLSNVFLILIAVLNFGLAFFVYFQTKKCPTNSSVAFFSIFVAFWALSIFLFQTSEEILYVTYFLKFSYVCALFIAAGYYYFSICFPENEIPDKRQVLFMVIPIALFDLFLLIPGFLTRKVIPHEWGREVVLGQPEYVALFIIFVGFFVG